MYSIVCISSWYCFCSSSSSSSRGKGKSKSRGRDFASSLLFVASTALVALVELNVEAKELPLSPINLTIEEIFSTAAVLKWTVVSFDVEDESMGGSSSSGHFQLIVQRIGHPVGTNGGDQQQQQQLNGHSSRIIDVPGIARSFLIQFLIPDTGYRVYAATINDHGRSNFSDPVDFQTLLDGAVHLQHYQMHSAEVAIIVFILSAWICTVGLFLHKWRRIRILPPREPRFKHNPKNLDTIKVVKRPTDSVIYKSYTKQISTTMQARQKKLERMSTMPNIKVVVEASSSPDGSRKTGSRSALCTLIETRDGIRQSASGPAALDVFEQLLACPPQSTHLLQAACPADGVGSGSAVDGEGIGGRKRVSSDSEVIRMAKELPDVGKRWTKDVAGKAARVVQIRTDWDRESAARSAAAATAAASSGAISKNVNKDSSSDIMETELSLTSSNQDTKTPINASKITLVLTNFEEEIGGGDETLATDFHSRLDSESRARESFEMTATHSTQSDDDVTSDVITQTYHEQSVGGDSTLTEIKVTQMSGIWGTNDVNEDKYHMLMNCDDISTATSSAARDFCVSLDEDVAATTDCAIVEEHCASGSGSKYLVGADETSSSVSVESSSVEENYSS